MNPDDFWKPFEGEANSFDAVRQIIHGVFDQWSDAGRVFAWRGQVDAARPLHSSLYRRHFWTVGGANPAPDEASLYEKEGNILADVHRWGLHMGERGRLSILGQLAMLQHYGAPTRLIDVTFNPFIGLWFAVEEKRDNGELKYENTDGRLFAIDVTDRLINENGAYRAWEDELHRPWPKPAAADASAEHKESYREWRTQVFAWRPPHFDSRMAAQNGGFIFGGVPYSGTADHPQQWPKTTTAGADKWTIDEVRQSTSLALRAHKLEPQGGGVADNAAYTIRIKAAAKNDIRNRLENLFGYRHSTIYPDFTGFASFGTPDLKSRP